MSGSFAPAGGGHGPPASHWHRAPAGDGRPRLSRHSVLLAFGLVLAGALVVAVVLALLSDAPEPPPDCAPGTQCGGPPPADGGQAPTVSAPPAVPTGKVVMRAGTPWTNTELGYEFEYTDWWAVDSTNSVPGEAHLVYQGTAGDGLLVVAAVPTSQVGAQAYADQWFGTLKEWAPDLKADESGKNAILGPEIGFVDGIGRTFAGSWTSPQSATTPVGIALVVASDGRTTAAVIVIVWNPDKTVGTSWLQYRIRDRAEIVLKTFRWGPLP